MIFDKLDVGYRGKECPELEAERNLLLIENVKLREGIGRADIVIKRQQIQVHDVYKECVRLLRGVKEKGISKGEHRYYSGVKKVSNHIKKLIDRRYRSLVEVLHGL